MIGATLSPFDGFLLLRGLKTLHVRMDRSIENARKVATHFENHEAIDQVLYAGTTGMLSLRFKIHIVYTPLEHIEVRTFAESPAERKLSLHFHLHRLMQKCRMMSVSNAV